VPLFVFNYSLQLLSCVAAYCSVLVGVLLSDVAFVNIVIKHFIFQGRKALHMRWNMFDICRQVALRLEHKCPRKISKYHQIGVKFYAHHFGHLEAR